jgi:hypothetical protein
VGGLHARQHPQLSHSPEIVRVNDLGMFDANRGDDRFDLADERQGRPGHRVPRPHLRVLDQDRLPAIEHGPVTPVSDRVNRALESGVQGVLHPGSQGVCLDDEKTPVSGIVGVIADERGTPRAHGPVHEELDHPQLECASLPLPVRAPVQDLLKLRIRGGYRGIDPSVELALLLQLPVDGQLARAHAHVVGAGETGLGHGADGPAYSP